MYKEIPKEFYDQPFITQKSILDRYCNGQVYYVYLDTENQILSFLDNLLDDDYKLFADIFYKKTGSKINWPRQKNINLLIYSEKSKIDKLFFDSVKKVYNKISNRENFSHKELISKLKIANLSEKERPYYSEFVYLVEKEANENNTIDLLLKIISIVLNGQRNELKWITPITKSRKNPIPTRESLIIAFNICFTDRDFDGFCLDKFINVWRHFTNSMAMEYKINLLLNNFSTSEIMKALRRESPSITENVEKYLKYEPSYVEPRFDPNGDPYPS